MYVHTNNISLLIITCYPWHHVDKDVKLIGTSLGKLHTSEKNSTYVTFTKIYIRGNMDDAPYKAGTYVHHVKNYQSSLLADGSFDWLGEVLR